MLIRAKSMHQEDKERNDEDSVGRATTDVRSRKLIAMYRHPVISILRVYTINRHHTTWNAYTRYMSSRMIAIRHFCLRRASFIMYID